MTFKRIDHVEVAPENVAKTIDFYADVLGVSIKIRKKWKRSSLKEFVYLALGDTVLEIISETKPKDAFAK